MNLEDAISKRYAHESEAGQEMRKRVLCMCNSYLAAGLGDKNAAVRLCSQDNAPYWQQLSEVLLADQLNQVGIMLSHPKDGPDFLTTNEQQKIWIEVITPEPTDLPHDWINFISGRSVESPHEKILLRWTAAIKEKSEKLLGNDKPGYLGKGIVQSVDAYVIAVNARLLRGFGGAFPELYGISQFPYAVEATLSVGPIQLQIDKENNKVIGQDHQYRPVVKKPNKADVPAGIFFETKFGMISAIWAVDVDECLLLGKSRPMEVVHNPKATNPVPIGWLPAQFEYTFEETAEGYSIKRVKGRL